MPFVVSWSPPSRASATFVDVVSSGELASSLAQIVGDLRFDQLRSVVCDFRAVAACDSRPAELETIGAVLYGAYVTNPRIVAVVITADAGAKEYLRRFLALGLLRYPLFAVDTPDEADQVIAQHA